MDIHQHELNFQQFINKVSQNNLEKLIKILVGLTGQKSQTNVIYSNFQLYNQLSFLLTEKNLYDPQFNIKIANRISIFIKKHLNVINQELNPIDQITDFFQYNASVYQLINKKLSSKIQIMEDLINSIQCINVYNNFKFEILKDSAEIHIKQKISNDMILDPVDQQILLLSSGVQNIQQSIVILIAVRNKYSISDEQSLYEGITQYFEK